MSPRACSLILLLGLAAGAAAAEIPVRGLVVADGEPLVGAVAELVPMRGDYERGLDILDGRLHPAPAVSVSTDESGHFELSAPEAGLWLVRVSAPGRVAMAFRLWPLVEARELPTVELRADAGQRVAVRGPDGEPAVGARIAAHSQNREIWQPSRFTRWFWQPADRGAATDDEGTALAQRAEDERLEVAAFAPGLVEAEPETASGGRIELRLRRGRDLPLRVLHPAGAPAAGALVWIGERQWVAGLTDADGRMTVSAPAGGEIVLKALTDDGETAELLATADPRKERREVEMILTANRRISGRVIDAVSREPIAGAFVWSGRDPGSGARTDRAGGFRLVAERGGGRDYLQAAAPGYFTDFLRLADDPGEEPVIALERTAAVEGRVVTADGEPVEGADVAVELIPGDRQTARRMRSADFGGARSSAAGLFRLGEVVPGVASRVRAAKPGLAPAEVELGALEPGEVRRGLELVLRAGVALTGTLVAPSGEPVAGADVSLSVESQAGTPFTGWPTPALTPPLRTVSGEDGGFEFQGLAKGLHRLSAWAAGYARLDIPGVEIGEESGRKDLGELSLEPGVDLAGVVRDAEGRPVAEAEVRLSDARGRMFFARGSDQLSTVLTGADGSFRFTGRRRGETVDLRVRREGYTAAEAPGVLVPPERPLAIVLEPAFAIRGVVVDAEGSPVAEATVSGQTVGGGVTSSGSPMGNFWLLGDASTDDAGRFRLADVPPGPVRLQAQARGWRNSEALDVEMPADRDIEGLRLELRRGASIAGRVSTADGLPAIGVAVQIEEPAEGFSYANLATTDGDGRYLLAGVAPGSRLVVAIDERHGRTARKLEVSPGANQLDLQFSSGVTVSGRVTDGQGLPLVGASVQLLGSATAWQGEGAQSGDDGGFLIEGVKEGSYFARTIKQGFATHITDEALEVGSEPIAGLEIQLAPGGAIVGALIGLEPAELVDVEIIAASPPARFTGGAATHDGRYRIPDLGPGEWMVQATLPGGRKASGRAEIEPGQAEAVLDLDFESGLVLTGLVVTDGEPRSGLMILLIGEDRQSWTSVRTDHQGRFRAAGLEPGSHRLEIADLGGGTLHREKIVLDADRDVVIDIAGATLAGRVVDAVSRVPLSAAVVSLARADEPDDEPTRYVLAGGTTDGQGRFVVEAAAGEYLLRAVKEGYAPAQQSTTILAGADVAGLEIALEPTRGLDLAVRLPSGGVPGEVTFALLDPAGLAVAFGSRPVDDEGIVRLSTAPAGRFELLLGAEGAAVARQAVEVPGPVVPVALLPGCRLEIVVGDLRGDDSAAAATLQDPAGRPVAQPTWSPVPQSRWQLFSGRVLVEGLSSGVHRVRVEAADGRSWEGSVTVAPGRSNRLEL